MHTKKSVEIWTKDLALKTLEATTNLLIYIW
jgi:hypothetical protein